MREPVSPQHLIKPDDGSGARESRESKRNALSKSISTRLRSVCSRMPSAEFDAMVRNMADIEMKYADQTTPSHPNDRAD